MSNNTKNHEDEFISRDRVREAIEFLSSVELYLDKKSRTDGDQLSNSPTFFRKSSDDVVFSRKHFASFFWNSLAGIVLAIAGIPVALWFIEQEYFAARNVSAPVLSVEYAYFHEIGSLNKEPVARIIHQLAQFEDYGEFVMSSMGRHDLRHIDAMGAEIGTGDARKLASIVSMYREFLLDQKRELHQKEANIPGMQISELRMQGRAELESIDGLDTEGIRVELVEKVQADQDNIDDRIIALDSLDRTLTQIQNRLFVKLSIFNDGGRPGLVRPRGFIEYSETCYKMGRVEAPPQDNRPIAVPTYVVNPEAGGVAQTVGKIDSDTMVEYWYEIYGSISDSSSCAGLKENTPIAGTSEPNGCPDEEVAIVYLFDHDNEELISQDVGCDAPLS